jgi:hypothetical protein
MGWWASEAADEFWRKWHKPGSAEARTEEMRRALRESVSCLEECATLLAEMVMRFGDHVILDDTLEGATEWKFSEGVKMYFAKAKEMREKWELPEDE